MLTVNKSKNIIELQEVSFLYGSNLILDKISLIIKRGDYLGLVGPNGAGKTTLLKIILGLLIPSKGRVKLFGVDLKNFQEHSRISYVPQQATNFDLNFPATVLEVVSMGRYAQKGLFHNLQKEDLRIIDDSLEQVAMQDYKNALIGDLSGGQTQRVFIARALASQPELILFDEPTTGIDQKSQDDFYKLLRELNHKLGLTLVLVSHDNERLIKEVGRIACLDHNLVLHNSPADFIQACDSLNIYGQEVKVITHHHH